MTLKAHLVTDAYGNITVQMRGGLDYENTGSLEKELAMLIHENPQSDIVLDMNSVDFVGSSGIGTFLKIIQDINSQKKKDKVKLSNVRPEFLKVFQLYTQDPISKIVVDDFAFDNDETDLAETYLHRGRTFEN